MNTDTREFIRSYYINNDGKLVVELGTGEKIITDISKLNSIKETSHKEIEYFDKLLKNKKLNLDHLKLISIGEKVLIGGLLTGSTISLIFGNIGESLVLISASIGSMGITRRTNAKIKKDTIEYINKKKEIKLFKDDLEESFSKEKEYKYKNNKQENNTYDFIKPYENTKEKVISLKRK